MEELYSFLFCCPSLFNNEHFLYNFLSFVFVSEIEKNIDTTTIYNDSIMNLYQVTFLLYELLAPSLAALSLPLPPALFRARLGEGRPTG